VTEPDQTARTPAGLPALLRRQWRSVAWRVLLVVAVVQGFAIVQHRFVLGIPLGEIGPPLLVIPAIVGALFGLLIATIGLMQRQSREHLRLFEARERELRREARQRHETAAREQRLHYAIEGANDGLWDWNVASGEVFFSPRLQAMLGYDDDAVPARMDFWWERLHPDDAAAVLEALNRHLRADSPQFQHEFRMRAASGEWVWVLGRGKVVDREPDGAARRAVGTFTDISDRKRVELALQGLLAGTAGALGEAFFRNLVRALAEAFDARVVFLGLLDPPARERLDSLAVWDRHDLQPRLSCPVPGSPHAIALARGGYLVAERVRRYFPNDPILERLAAEGYLGAPLVDTAGERLGVLAVVDDRPLPKWKLELAQALLPVFAARASAEIERRRIEAALIDQKERAEVTLHSIGDAVITTDAAGRIEYLNPAAEAITGWPAAEALGTPIAEVCATVDELSRLPLPPLTEQCLARGEAVPGAGGMLLVSRQHEERVVEQTAAPITDRAGTVTGSVVVLRDVTGTREMARQMRWQATHDALTGLVNRQEFERRVAQLIAAVRRGGPPHALLYLDLDEFKVVNDTCGHSAGDELLRQLTLLLKGAARQSDTVARLGGDEFGLLLAGCEAETARRVAEKLIDTIQHFRFPWDDKLFDVGASIGIVEITRETEGVGSVLGAADMACYAAKERGRNRIHAFEIGDEQLSQRHAEMQWVARIQQAIDAGDLLLYAQEIQPLRGPGPGHYEVLVRLRAEDGRVIPPGSFIPAAERYNVTPQIDRYVIRQVFGHIRAHPALRELGYAINLSGKSLNDERLLAFVLEQAQADGVDPRQICFEITETAAIGNLKSAVTFIGELRRHGFRFALDDFGSGLSSFGYLKHLPVDYLKIDGGFVRNIVHDRIDAAMVHAIHGIGQTIGIETIAEFVEDAHILAELRKIGVDYAQGYHLHRPEPLADLTARLAASAACG
jgi:diguanylate cyclase (GGDEF)-like protein/PAS domain S-box-containing protein